MCDPPIAAANRYGARSLPAAAYQKSSSPLPAAGLVLAPEHNHAAVLRAPCHVVHAASGDHVVARSPVEPVGSYTQVGPRALRPLMVSRTRSRFTEVAITGPSHSSTA